MGNSLLFLDISGGEFLVIMLAAFFVFGPKKLPEVARKIGRTMNEIKNVSSEITKEFKEETKNITTEIKTAREEARKTTLELEKNINSPQNSDNQLPRRKSVIHDKPTADVNVSIDDNNNQSSNNVNGENNIS